MTQELHPFTFDVIVRAASAEHANRVMAERLDYDDELGFAHHVYWLPLDTESSASRGHYIATGRYLAVGEAHESGDAAIDRANNDRVQTLENGKRVGDTITWAVFLDARIGEMFEAGWSDHAAGHIDNSLFRTSDAYRGGWLAESTKEVRSPTMRK